MWRKRDVLDFVGWLRAHNDAHGRDAAKRRLLRPRPLQPVQLDRGGARATSNAIDPEAAQPRARALRLLRPLRRGPAGLRLRRRVRLPTHRARTRSSSSSSSCSAAPATHAPRRRRRRGRVLLRRAERAAGEERRGVLPHDVPRPRARPGTCATGTWSETLDALASHLGGAARRRRAKVVVWAHNSHLGDARATEMGERGELERRPARARAPPATAADRLHAPTPAPSPRPDWDEPAERKRVRPALPGSYEALFHERRPRAFPARLARRRRRSPRALRGAAAGARDRRHLPARDRARRATTSTPGSPTSSTR